MESETSAVNGDRYLIRNGRIVQPSGILDGDLAVENGTIAHLGESLQDAQGYSVIDANRAYVLPGFIDLHCHGGLGFDLTVGQYDPTTKTFDTSPQTYERALPRLMRRMAENGTTRCLLATIAADEELLKPALRKLSAYLAGGGNGQDGTLLDGVFLEGTFVKNPAFSGAMNADHFREPDLELFERLNEAAGGALRYVNVVPEYGESAIELTKCLAQRGVLVGAGHTEVSADDYGRAVENGLRVAIHFTNGPTGSSFKPFGGGNAVEAVLRSREVYAELIVDGYHVNPAYIRDIIKRKGVDRIIGISDAMFLADMTGVTDFSVGGIAGRVSDNGAYLQVLGKANTLFGSVLNMRVGFGNLLSWLTSRMEGIWNEEHSPMGLEEALLAASTMCSANPAAALGLLEPDGPETPDLADCVGSLEVGKRADLSISSVAGEAGDYELTVEKVFIGGQPVV